MAFAGRLEQVTLARPELRIVNPNTDLTVTRWLCEEARRVVGDAFDVVGVNADSGLAAIQTPAHIAVAAEAVISAIRSPPCPAGVIIAAFGDPGLDEARALGLAQMVGLGESGLLAAASGGRRFSIVTLGAAMRDTIRSKAAALGLADRLAEVCILPFSIADMIQDRDSRRDAILTAIRACVMEQGVEALLLGGAPFAGLAALYGQETGATVLDGVEASVARLIGSPSMARE